MLPTELLEDMQPLVVSRLGDVDDPVEEAEHLPGHVGQRVVLPGHARHLLCAVLVLRARHPSEGKGVQTRKSEPKQLRCALHTFVRGVRQASKQVGGRIGWVGERLGGSTSRWAVGKRAARAQAGQQDLPMGQWVGREWADQMGPPAGEQVVKRRDNLVHGQVGRREHVG